MNSFGKELFHLFNSIECVNQHNGANALILKKKRNGTGFKIKICTGAVVADCSTYILYYIV